MSVTTRAQSNSANQNPNPNQDQNPNIQNVPNFSVQKISFWPAHPAAWFRIIENQFTAARIYQESIKFNHVISMLDSQMIENCMDLIENLDAETPYNTFKEGVIARMAESEQSRLQKVLLGTDLGDRKPSELLSKMQSLAGDSVRPEALKTLWLQRLPTQVRAILAVSSEELTKLALLGDKILETVNHQSIASTSTNNSVSAISGTSKIEEQISQLTMQFEKFRNNFKQSDRNRSRSRSRYNNNEKICYYHKRFGNNAKKCTKWCKFNQSNVQSGSENSFSENKHANQK